MDSLEAQLLKSNLRLEIPPGFETFNPVPGTKSNLKGDIPWD